jgi:hypothetical protein
MSKKNLNPKKAVLHIFDHEEDGVWGCGACLISLLTGIDPIHLYKKNKKRNPHWPEDLVVDSLKAFGFQVNSVSLNKYGLINPKVVYSSPLVTVQRMNEKDTSYQFIYCGLVWHNFEARPFKALEFIQRPLVSCWLINHKTWK